MMKKQSSHCNMKRDLLVKSNKIEAEMVLWIWRMWRNNVFITDTVIIEKSTRVQEEINRTIPERERTGLRFSNGRLAFFKKRNKFKTYKSHGEQAYVYYKTIAAEFPLLQTLVSV